MPVGQHHRGGRLISVTVDTDRRNRRMRPDHPRANAAGWTYQPERRSWPQCAEPQTTKPKQTHRSQPREWCVRQAGAKAPISGKSSPPTEVPRVFRITCTGAQEGVRATKRAGVTETLHHVTWSGLQTDMPSILRRRSVLLRLVRSGHMRATMSDAVMVLPRLWASDSYVSSPRNISAGGRSPCFS